MSMYCIVCILPSWLQGKLTVALKQVPGCCSFATFLAINTPSPEQLLDSPIYYMSEHRIRTKNAWKVMKTKTTDRELASCPKRSRLQAETRIILALNS